ncbi:MAG: hypothetical protein GEU82_09320 [Luteitalea sp.]|nr:hypothetical protein [Luteitalea sp.]
MPDFDLWTWLENLPIAVYIGETWWFPFLESIHVLTSTFLLGSILMLDLRLLGLAGRNQAASRIATEIVPWTRGAFVISALAGLGMFISQANRYVDNRAFQVKAVLLVLAGINMAVFHLRTVRHLPRWDTAAVTSAAARFAGAASLLLWIAIMLAGRWIGHLL